MKFFSTFVLILVSFSVISPQLSSANDSERFDRRHADALESTLIDMFHESMEPLARQEGWTLEENETEFSFDEEVYAYTAPLAALTAGTGYVGGALLSARTGAAIFGVFHGTVGAAIGGFVGAHSGGTGVLSILAAGGALVLGGLDYIAELLDSLTIITPRAIMDCYNGEKIRCAVYMPVNDHYKIQIKYQIKEVQSNRKESGDCDFFFKLGVDGLVYTPSREIDSCTHANIFRQEQLGSMRIGGSAGFWDRLWGQDMVVVGPDGDIIEN